VPLVVQYFLLPSAATLCGVVAIIDGARLWPVGHNPALHTDATAIAQGPGGSVSRWPNGSTGSSPMKKPRMQPVQGPVELLVLLLNEHLLAAGLLPHQGADTAAEALPDVELAVPERAGAEAGHDGEIQANIDEGSAEGAAANLTLEILRAWHEEVGIVPAGGSDGHGAALGVTEGSVGCSGGGVTGARR
jgi:hypothetical protein